MHRLLPLATLLLTGLLSSCNTFESANSQRPTVERNLDTVRVTQQQAYEQQPYQPAATRHMDLIHTKLKLEPLWQEESLRGKATLTVTPYFYPQDSIVLDAHNFSLKAVELKQDSANQSLSYTYDTQKLVVQLPYTYRQGDTAKLFINYTAQLANSGNRGQSAAGSKGMFFINADRQIPEKPRQIWTQGETEYSSHWFPTFDRPNEKTTQELYVTVDTNYKTLSNGKHVYGATNPDGTRTDYWKQEQPHAPYLFMLAVGKFAKVNDTWHDSIPVNYYVEPQYERYADMVFGQTPSMMTFYSELFNYAYPWAKYSQVAVRDFIAGAMENTSATIHFSGVQHNRRKHKHRTYETLIAHELIHHWFGNLVTCESWANLALNESFATYGEHLWMEHAHGAEAAAIEWQNDRRRYLYEARNKQVPVVQYHYQSPGQLFDAHRYQKGACILKMLRATLGDHAFFKGVSRYLHQHEYQPVEYHDLRLALEAVSGRDLQWFFDQWFRSPGHPELKITHAYDAAQQEVVLTVEQQQDTTTTPVYQLPVQVNVHHQEGRVTEHKVRIRERVDTFRFHAPLKPLLVNFDANKVLLAEKIIPYPPEAWIYQFRNTDSYLNHHEALTHLADDLQALSMNTANAVVRKALNSQYRRIRQLGLDMVTDTAYPELQKNFAGKVKSLAQKDPETHVRGAAYLTLSQYENPGQFLETFRSGLTDSAYYVVRKALSALERTNTQLALKASQDLERTRSDALLIQVSRLRANHGSEQTNSFLQQVLWQRPDLRRRFGFVKTYLGYLKRMGPDFFQQELPALSKLQQWIAGQDDRSTVLKALKSYRNAYQEELKNEKAADKERKEFVREAIIRDLNDMIETFQRQS